jgi:hypothetical protein
MKQSKFHVSCAHHIRKYAECSGQQAVGIRQSTAGSMRQQYAAGSEQYAAGGRQQTQAVDSRQFAAGTRQ